MSGKLIFRTRRGRSRDPRYREYLEWYMEVIDENGHVKARCSPTYDEFAAFIRKVLVHEYRNDATRMRKQELGIKYRKLLGGLSQMKIDMANIPYKYYAANMTWDELRAETEEETYTRADRLNAENAVDDEVE